MPAVGIVFPYIRLIQALIPNDNGLTGQPEYTRPGLQGHLITTQTDQAALPVL